MPQSSCPQIEQLQACLSLAKDPSGHAEAVQKFEQLRETLAKSDPGAAEMLNLLWHEVLTARRSATFWQEVCNVEKELSERIAASHIQLKQNYQRLMQEQ